MDLRFLDVGSTPTISILRPTLHQVELRTTGHSVTHVGLTRLTKVEAKGEDVARRSRATASKSRAF